MSEPNKVELVSHSVIERQLLVELSDKSKVAILATEDDLDTMIAALKLYECDRVPLSSKWSELRLSLEQLKREAFGH